MASPAPLAFPHANPENGLVVGVYGDKGGIGKSTIATNFAYELGRRGRSTLLIDVNKLQKSSSSKAVFEHLKVEAGYRLVVEDEPENLARVRDIPGFAFKIIDLPPSPEEARHGLEQCDVVIVPAVLGHLTTAAVVETLQDVIPEGPVPLVVLNMIPPSRELAKESPRVTVVRQGLTAMGVRVCESVLRKYACYSDAQGDGYPITHSPERYDRGDKASKDITALVDEFLFLTTTGGGDEN
jgi:cellulose biosynthesis protein BcsQ